MVQFSRAWEIVRARPVDAQSVEDAVQVGQGQGHGRQDGQGEGAGQERERIEIAGQVEAEQGADEDGDQDVVLGGQAGLVFAGRLEESGPLEQERRGLVDGPQGADPAAEDAAEKDGGDDRDQGEDEVGIDEARRDDGDQGQERVEVEKALDGRADVVLARVVGPHEEIEEEAEEHGLAGHPGELEGAVLPRSFFFQGGPSPDRIRPGRGRGRGSGRAARGARPGRARRPWRRRPRGPCRR